MSLLDKFFGACIDRVDLYTKFCQLYRLMSPYGDIYIIDITSS